jgi:hypothetical protein
MATIDDDELLAEVSAALRAAGLFVLAAAVDRARYDVLAIKVLDEQRAALERACEDGDDQDPEPPVH